MKQTKQPKRQQKPNRKKPTGKIKIIPLGGMGEIGKNMTVLEYDGEMLVIDCGSSFPDESMPGIELVIPDFTYLLDNRDRIKAVLIHD